MLIIMIHDAYPFYHYATWSKVLSESEHTTPLGTVYLEKLAKMKFSAALIFTIASTASAESLLSNASMTSTCGPQVKVCLADFLDAAGSPSYECKEAVDGAKVHYPTCQMQ